MLRISRLTDYGTVVLAQMADQAGRTWTAAELSSVTGVAAPTVSKLLKALARGGLLESFRGATGGYRLARQPAEISAADILDALEGPLSLTECSSADSDCELEPVCRVGNAWQSINAAIRQALEDVSLTDLTSPDGSAIGPVSLKRPRAADGAVPLHFRPRQ